MELFAEDICAKNGITYNPTYSELTQKLRRINSALGIWDDYEFARRLYETDVTQRYSWMLQLAKDVEDPSILSDIEFFKERSIWEAFLIW